MDTWTEDARLNSILETLDGEVIECSAEDWFEAYAPSAQMDAALSEAILTSLHTIDDSGNILLGDRDGWLRYQEAKRHGEAEAFQCAFEDVVDIIEKVAKEYDPERYADPMTTDGAPASISTKSGGTGYRFFSDWIFSPTQPPESSTEAAKSDEEKGNSVIVARFKLEDDDEARLANQKKLVGDAIEILYSDPRRTGAIGFTIEASGLRMWHFSRSHVARSEKVNIDDNPGVLVQFFTLVLFASLEELGFDPTVTRHFVTSRDWDEKSNRPLEVHKVVYRYMATDAEGHTTRTYQTFGKPISEDAAYCIASRATRVWIVTEVIVNKSPHEVDVDASSPNGTKLHKALKDVWLYEDGLNERETQNKIISALLEDSRAHARRHFLKIDVEGFVGGKNGVTPRCDKRDIRWSPERGFERIHVARWSSSPEAQARDPHARRRHHRTVFAEVCKSVYELKDFGEFFTCTLGVVKALFSMKTAKYIHRDVSAGNCLVHTDPETGVLTGKISDMEYALHYESISTKTPKIGTPDFMAVEYQCTAYLHLPDSPEASSEEEDVLQGSQPKIVAPSNTPRELVFIPNFLHDLESVLWQYIWLLHFRVPIALVVDESNASLAKYRKFLEAIELSRQALFTHGRPTRQNFITIPDQSIRLKNTLEALYGRSSPLLEPLGLLHNLRQAYRRAEKTEPVDILGDDGKAMVSEYGWVQQRLPPSAFGDKLYGKMISTFGALAGVESALKDIAEWEEELDRKTASTPPLKSATRGAAAVEGKDSEGEPPRKVVKHSKGKGRATASEAAAPPL